jgi:hypothetical protein
MNQKPFQQPRKSSREERRADERAKAKQGGDGLNPYASKSAPFGKFSYEAFCLMWYACKCGHRERIWNSRDGVTPFGMACPSCKEPTLQHVDWKLDEYAPNHAPAVGQRVWISMSRDRAMEIAKRTLARMSAVREFSPDDLTRVAESIFNDGLAPDCVVYGYVEAE